MTLNLLHCVILVCKVCKTYFSDWYNPINYNIEENLKVIDTFGFLSQVFSGSEVGNAVLRKILSIYSFTFWKCGFKLIYEVAKFR